MNQPDPDASRREEAPHDPRSRGSHDVAVAVFWAVGFVTSVVATYVASRMVPVLEPFSVERSLTLVVVAWAGPLLFLAWWGNATRVLAGLLGMALVVVGVYGQVLEARNDALVAGSPMAAERFEGLSETVARTGVLDAAFDSTAAPLPEATADRRRWAVEQAYRVEVATGDSLARVHGVATLPPVAPDDPQYLATAADWPQMQRYWEGYRAFASDARRILPERFREALVYYRQASGVAASTTVEFTAAVMAVREPVLEEAYAAVDSMAVAGLAVHRTAERYTDELVVGEQGALLGTTDRAVEAINEQLDRLDRHQQAVQRIKQEGMAELWRTRYGN